MELKPKEFVKESLNIFPKESMEIFRYMAIVFLVEPIDEYLEEFLKEFLKKSMQNFLKEYREIFGVISKANFWHKCPHDFLEEFLI